jgi:cytochrome c peroxidase
MSKHQLIGLGFCTLLCVLLLVVSIASAHDSGDPTGDSQVDQALEAILRQAGFTGRIEATLEQRLGRHLDRRLADVGRLLWFDTITGLNDDNTCAGCHSPTAGFGDTQSIAIGIHNNGVVGPDRAGPRNMRRAPLAINTAFFPNLMWNSRFAALSGSPFDNRAGFLFPLPEGTSLSSLPHLLTAQAFIPPTERNEVAGFTFVGDNDAIRAAVLARLNQSPAYRKLFANVFPQVRAGGPITFAMFGQAIAEFEFTLTFATAPIDRFARGDRAALSADEKRGALLFFGKGSCVTCHRVAGQANEMFSDFEDHVIAVPQLVPHVTNSPFDGSETNQDFGREEVTGDQADRYKFRTPPLRNVAVQPAFMHDGAFTSLEAAVRHHLDVASSLRHYTPTSQHLAADLTGATGPRAPLLERLDPRLREPIILTDQEIGQLVAFVRNGLLDPRAKPGALRRLVPKSVPSGRAPLRFEFPEPAP